MWQYCIVADLEILLHAEFWWCLSTRWPCKPELQWYILCWRPNCLEVSHQCSSSWAAKGWAHTLSRNWGCLPQGFYWFNSLSCLPSGNLILRHSFKCLSRKFPFMILSTCRWKASVSSPQMTGQGPAWMGLHTQLQIWRKPWKAWQDIYLVKHGSLYLVNEGYNW
jgi:hypothetical protein